MPWRPFARRVRVPRASIAGRASRDAASTTANAISLDALMLMKGGLTGSLTSYHSFARLPTHSSPIHILVSPPSVHVPCHLAPSSALTSATRVE